MTAPRTDWPADLAAREAALAGDPLPERFDARAVWDALPPGPQREIGAAAVLLAYTDAAAAHVGPLQATAFLAALRCVEERLLAALAPVLAVPARVPLRPDLAVFGLAACRVCGCTDAVACPEGCTRVEPDLCSACAARGLPPW